MDLGMPAGGTVFMSWHTLILQFSSIANDLNLELGTLHREWDQYLRLYEPTHGLVLSQIGITFVISVICCIANVVMRISPRLHSGDDSIVHPLAEGELGLDLCMSALAVGLTSSVLLLVAVGFSSMPTGVQWTRWHFPEPISFGLSLVLVVAAAMTTYYLLQWGARIGAMRKRGDAPGDAVGVVLILLTFLMLLFSVGNPHLQEFLAQRLVNGLSVGWAVAVPICTMAAAVVTRLIMFKLKSRPRRSLARFSLNGASIISGFVVLFINIAYAGMRIPITA